MKYRALLVTGIAASTAITGLTAGANAVVRRPPPPKPVCDLIKDAPGDTSGGGKLGADPAMDVQSADIASDVRNVTAVIRLGAAPAANDPNAPEGASYYFIFDTAKAANPIYLEASTAPLTGALSYAYGDLETTAATGTITYTQKGSATGALVGTALHITVPTGTLGSLASMKPGTKLTALEAKVTYDIGLPPNPTPVFAESIQPADDELGNAPYFTGTPSCVKPGS